MQTFSGNASVRPSSNVPHLPSFRTCYKTLAYCSLFTRCKIPCACPRRTISNVKKCPAPVRFALLTWTCASRDNGAHSLDISTSKSGPTLVFFVHFDLEMCFAPRQRALTRHSNFQKCSESVFNTFDLEICFAHNDLFAHLHLLSPRSFSSLIFSVPLFSCPYWVPELSRLSFF